jgi:hypothetical protein
MNDRDAQEDADTPTLPPATLTALRELLAEHGATIDDDGLTGIDSLAAVLLIEDIELRLGICVPARLVTATALSSWSALCALVSAGRPR